MDIDVYQRIWGTKRKKQKGNNYLSPESFFSHSPISKNYNTNYELRKALLAAQD